MTYVAKKAPQYLFCKGKKGEKLKEIDSMRKTVPYEFTFLPTKFGS
jgi:hypothetical protein